MNDRKSSLRQGPVIAMMLFPALGFLLLAVRDGSTTAALLAGALPLLILLADTVIAGIMGADRLLVSMTAFFCSLGLLVRACTLPEITLPALAESAADLSGAADALILPAVVLAAAFGLSRRQVLLSFLSLGVGAALLFLLGKHESALLLGAAVVLMYWMSGAGPFGLLAAVCALVGMAFLAWSLSPGIRDAFGIWQDPEAFAESGAPLPASLAAISAGGLFGTGPRLVSFDLLPASSPWFAFAALCHQFGMITAILTLILFGLMPLRGASAARAARGSFHSLSAAGASLLLGLAALSGAAGAAGILPSTGIPFPFLSGGTSLIRDLLLSAILCWVSGRNRQDLKEDASLAMLAH